VSVLDALEDLAAPLGPLDGLLIVGMQRGGELREELVDLGPLPKIQRRPPDVVDRWQCRHGRAPPRGPGLFEEVRTPATLEAMS
jgi:hypothetical protein